MQVVWPFAKGCPSWQEHGESDDDGAGSRCSAEEGPIK